MYRQHQQQQQQLDVTGHWGDGKQKLWAVERCRFAPNTEFTTINLLYFLFYVFYLLSFVFVDTMQQNYKKVRTKLLQKPLSHFSYRNIDNILKNYKYLQSLLSLQLLCESGATSCAACHFVKLLSVWKCAVCVCGSLLVCFCQRRRVTSAFQLKRQWF